MSFQQRFKKFFISPSHCLFIDDGHNDDDDDDDDDNDDDDDDDDDDGIFVRPFFLEDHFQGCRPTKIKNFNFDAKHGGTSRCQKFTMSILSKKA